jgi:hypothetical protein
VLRCAHRAEAPSSAMVELMIGPVMSFASAYHSGDGLAGKWWRRLLENAHKEISLDCAGELAKGPRV